MIDYAGEMVGARQRGEVLAMTCGLDSALFGPLEAMVEYGERARRLVGRVEVALAGDTQPPRPCRVRGDMVGVMVNNGERARRLVGRVVVALAGDPQPPRPYRIER